MDILLTSTLIVALAEIGDKTQLLAIVLAARFRKPGPIILGILAATLANHALAAWAGATVAGLLDGTWFRIAVGISFLAMAGWMLIPDELEDEAEAATARGAFIATLIAFFLVEIGDKTQIATIALGARYQEVMWVTAGTTLGMMIANVPAVLFGDRILGLVPVTMVHRITASLFAGIGLWILADAFGLIGGS